MKSGVQPSAWPALDALVTEVVETRRATATLQAREARLLSEAIDLVADRAAERRATGQRLRESDLPAREVAFELAAAMRLSDRTVQGRMSDAVMLATRLPATLRAWEAGDIDAGHAGAILDAGSMIDDDAARARFESLALEAAETESPARLRAVAKAIAARVDPGSVEERIARSQADRFVRVIPRDDGIARLLADLPAVLAYAIEDRLTQMARDVKDAELSAQVTADSGGATKLGRGDTDDVDRSEQPGDVVHTGPTVTDGIAARARTMDQLRADVLADLLLTGSPVAHGDGGALGAIQGRVQVTVPVLTLAGIDHEPALLAGHGPIDAATARILAAGAPGWDRVLTDPITGVPLAVDKYRPDATLDRYLRARDEHCRAMGCTMPVWRCDTDHTKDAAHGGPTECCNLAHLCRHHHMIKHATAWLVRQLGCGVLEWTSPAGRIYVERPPAAVRFVPNHVFTPRAGASVDDGDPPPF
ncbi:DUF222 domain-containing protein [Microbacterium sp. NPDC019599]|uniref:HNH endonuclease signature motif containing protein n=1 Tax=Microbacterium sp. NPDC019599 TaxID=3154690 RepID=UPI0033DA7BA7